MSARIKHLNGTTWNGLTLVQRNGASRGDFKCQCGKTKNIKISHVVSGLIKSCGCMHNKLISQSRRRPSVRENGVQIPEYAIWKAMRRRCNSSHDKYYDIYGGRGITVCKRWDSFHNFITDLGRRPSNKHSIDRIDTNGNYEPNNCRWATSIEQANNRRDNVFYVHNNVRHTVSEWARILSTSSGVLHTYVKRNGFEKAYEHYQIQRSG